MNKLHLRFSGQGLCCYNQAQKKLLPNTHLTAIPAILVLSALFALAPVEGIASLSFGESSFNTFGQAESFTASQDISFSTVTLWMQGYNSAMTGEDTSATLSLSLMTDGVNDYPPGTTATDPQATKSTAFAPINNSAYAPYTFNLSGTLTANTTYWFFVYLMVPTGGFYDCNWVDGGSPNADITINGTTPFYTGSFVPFDPTSSPQGGPNFALDYHTPSETPAPVPEPSTDIAAVIVPPA